MMTAVGANYASTLSGTHYKALMKICATALDRKNDNGDPPRWYYAGWEDLALGMGWNIPADTPANKKRRKNMRGEVNKVYQALVGAGAIQERPHPRDGRRKAYYVSLDPQRSTGKSPVETEPNSTGKSPTRSTGKSPTDRRANHPAPSIRREEETREDEQLGAGPQPQTARETDGLDDEELVLDWLSSWSGWAGGRVSDACAPLVRLRLAEGWEVPDLLAELQRQAEHRKSRDPAKLVDKVGRPRLRVVG